MKEQRCGGTKVLVKMHRSSPAEFGKDKIKPCPGCPDCFDLTALEARIGKYLTVKDCPVYGRKTRIWSVHDEDGGLLGGIRWHGAWRQYVFQPEDLTIFHNECLTDLAAFLTRINNDHREKMKARRKS